MSYETPLRGRTDAVRNKGFRQRSLGAVPSVAVHLVVHLRLEQHDVVEQVGRPAHRELCASAMCDVAIVMRKWSKRRHGRVRIEDADLGKALALVGEVVRVVSLEQRGIWQSGARFCLQDSARKSLGTRSNPWQTKTPEAPLPSPLSPCIIQK